MDSVPRDCFCQEKNLLLMEKDIKFVLLANTVRFILMDNRPRILALASRIHILPRGDGKKMNQICSIAAGIILCRPVPTGIYRMIWNGKLKGLIFWILKNIKLRIHNSPAHGSRGLSCFSTPKIYWTIKSLLRSSLFARSSVSDQHSFNPNPYPHNYIRIRIRIH
jgi:hypothetical protein